MKNVSVKLAVNVSPSTRTQTLDGVEYLVAPAVLMPVGVHNGSDGPIYYPEKELAKYAAAWNHKPVVVNHPTLNGEPISAADPKVIEESQIGFLLNMGFQDNKQKGEVWINKTKAVKVEPKILDNLSAGIKTEISTGLFVDSDEKEGTWNGEKYIGTAYNHRPDHLAILPDTKGAASIEDGAGLLANAAKQPFISDRIRQIANSTVTSEMSFSEITCELEDELRARFGKPGRSWYGFVYAVYSDKVIFEDDQYKLWMLGYSVKDGEAVLDSGDPTSVEVVVSYVTANGSRLTSNAGKLVSVPISSVSEKVTMNRDEVFAKIVGDGKPFSDTDKEALGKLPDDVFAKLTGIIPTPAPATNSVKPTVNTDPATKPEAKPTTLAELVANANLAQGEKDMLAEMAMTFSENKNRLIDVIVNAKGNVFKKEDLAGMSINILKGIAAPIMAAAPAPTANGYTLDRLLNFAPSAPLPTTNKKVPSPVLPTVNAEDYEPDPARKTGKKEKETVAA